VPGEWIRADALYVDAGISGKRMDTRPELQVALWELEKAWRWSPIPGLA
jgi:hypothetical protein